MSSPGKISAAPVTDRLSEPQHTARHPFPAGKFWIEGPAIKRPPTPGPKSANETAEEGALGEGLLPLPSLLPLTTTLSSPMIPNTEEKLVS